MTTAEMLASKCSDLELENLRKEFEIKKLRSLVDDLSEELDRSNRESSSYRESCKYWKNAYDEVMDNMAKLMWNVGKPITDEIKKYEQNINIGC